MRDRMNEVSSGGSLGWNFEDSAGLDLDNIVTAVVITSKCFHYLPIPFQAMYILFQHPLQLS